MDATDGGVEVTLRVPDGREGCVEWLHRGQSPEEVATILETAETLFTSAGQWKLGEADGAGRASGAAAVRAHALEMERLRAEHREEMKRALDEVRPVVEAQCLRDAEHQLDELRARHASEVHVLGAQAKGLRADVESLQSQLTSRIEQAKGERDDAVARAAAEWESELKEARTTLEQLKGREALVLSDARRDHDQQVAALESAHARELEYLQTLLRDIQAKSESTAELVMDKLRLQYDAQINSLQASHRQQVEQLQTQMARRDDEVRALQEGTFGKVESLVGSLCGNSARKGELGEDFVKWVHNGLELGTLSRTGKVQCPGHADFLWEHAPPDGTKIRALVENKHGDHANSKRDLSKFRDDVCEAAKTHSINAALYISLTERIAGKPKISVELFHGVPTMWVARDANDDLSATALVETAFSVFAHVWPLLSSKDADGVQSTMQHVCTFLKGQIGEHERLDASIKSFEKMADAIRREVMQLRRTRDVLVTNVYNFQARHLPHMEMASDALPPPLDAMETHLGKTVVAAIKAYLSSMPSKRSRYPKGIGDLASVLSTEDMAALSQAPGVFEAGLRRVKSETSAEAGRKRVRRGANPAAEVNEIDEVES